MATFVDVRSDEEQLQFIVQYVARLKRRKEGGADQQAENAAATPEGAQPEKDASAPSSVFENECTRLVQEGRTRDVLLKIISETDTIFSDQNDKEVEGCFSIFSHLITKTENNNNEIIQKIRDAVSSNTTDRPALRMRILSNLYYIFDDQQTRYDTFFTIAKYAQDSNNPDAIISKFKQVEQWLSTTGATTEQTRRFLKLARQILKDNNRTLQSHKMNVKYLQSYTPEESTTSEAIELAAQAVMEALSIEDLYIFDHLTEIPSVKALERDDKYKNLFQLLTISIGGKLDSLQSLLKQDPSVLKLINTTEDAAIRKIRLLSLSSLCTESREISYAAIASTLQVPEEEVENWIIEAVSAKLIEVKMNQIRRSVTVTSSVQRSFDGAQWSTLASQLKKWQTSVTQLLTVVRQIQTTHSQ